MSTDASTSSAAEALAIRRWLLLAVGSLVLAGLLSLALVVGRAPGLSGLITDPAFFRRCLVVHVDLSLVVWLYAFTAALLFLLPRAGQSSWASRAGVGVATGGVGLLVLAAAAPGAQPVLANYVPMIDHWSFAAGLVLFALGVLLAIVDKRLWPSEPAPGRLLRISGSAVVGLRATGVLLIIAALTFAASWVHTPPHLPADVRFELANWGGGHVLQAASSAAMVSTWLILIEDPERPLLPRALAAVAFGVLVLPWLAAPLLAARGVQDVAAREGFTTLMRWAIFPAVTTLGLTLLIRFWRRGAAKLDVRTVGFASSIGLTTLGFVLGACIRGSTTLVPAHYHAAIGGVTVAFMAGTIVLLEAVGLCPRPTVRTRRLVLWQPAIFALGQAVFALGFAWSGAHGMGRKLYGAEQSTDRLGAMLGLGVMSIGGLIAIVGGLLFLTLVMRAYWRAFAIRPRPLAIELGGNHV
ncbi:MAG: hypothetical protein KF718_00860 [Polyangiaceae bacterium]|nr:hypothetical protein [Polyangiaceae bacterium]